VTPSRWPQLRAGLIAIAIFFGLVEGCPLPPPDKTPAWEKGFVEPIRHVQQIVLTPVARLGPWLRISQRWALYQAPSRDKYRLWVEGQDTAGTWHLLFRAGDSEHDEDGELIDYSRPRGCWDPTDHLAGQYAQFAEWMTQRVLDRHPEFRVARVQLERVKLTDSAVVPTGMFIAPHIRQRPETLSPAQRALRGELAP
jgi:hypothetical protein